MSGPLKDMAMSMGKICFEIENTKSYMGLDKQIFCA